MTALAKKGGAVYNQNDFSCRSELPVAVENRKNEEPALLSTKLKMPRPRRDYVVRRSLFEKLKRCSEMTWSSSRERRAWARRRCFRLSLWKQG